MSAPPAAASAATVVAKKVVKHELPPLFSVQSLIKNMFTAGGITSIGDYACQGLEYWSQQNNSIDANIKKYHFENPSLTLQDVQQLPQFAKSSYFSTLINGDWKLDYRRLASVAGFGFCFFGPVGGIWYPALDRILHTKFPQFKPGTFKFVATKAGLEQVFLGPIYTAAFFPFTTIGEGGSFDDLVKKLKQDYLQTLILDETCWLFLAPVLYGLTPVKYQLPFASCLASLEAMLFSYIAHHSFSDLPIVGPLADKLMGGDKKVTATADV
jgi:hypothetical protein